MSVMAMAGAAGIGHWRLPLEWAVALDVVFAACIALVLTRPSAPRR